MKAIAIEGSTRRLGAAVLLVALAGCATGDARSLGGDGCWSALVVNRVRLRPQKDASMVAGTIQGSNESATNGFSILATLTTQPAEDAWTELQVENATSYRCVKYYGPPGTTGAIAELEFYSGSTRLSGAAFGTPGTDGHDFAEAFDGDPASSYVGAGTSNYVGIDVAAGHVVAAPTISPPGGSYAGTQRVTISTATPGATIRCTRDGSDPAKGPVCSGELSVGAGDTVVRAVATAPCMAASDEASAAYAIGGAPDTCGAFLAVGNSLTDTLDGYMTPISTQGGVAIDFTRYTAPGAGTYIYESYPTGGFGVPNVQVAVQTVPHQHLSFQPFQNLPCLPTGYANQALPKERSDAVLIQRAWDDAVAGASPSVRMWVYEAWPPTPAEGWRNCITGGSWLRDTTIWNPPAPASWEDAEQNQLRYCEAVRDGLIAARPGRPVPYIVPAGRALRLVKGRVEAGTFPGVARDAFWSTFFLNGGTDNHATPIGRYLVALVFHASLFQRDPRDLADTNLLTPSTVSAEQAAALQQVAYEAVSGYANSGYAR